MATAAGHDLPLRGYSQPPPLQSGFVPQSASPARSDVPPASHSFAPSGGFASGFTLPAGGSAALALSENNAGEGPPLRSRTVRFAPKRQYRSYSPSNPAPLVGPDSFHGGSAALLSGFASEPAQFPNVPQGNFAGYHPQAASLSSRPFMNVSTAPAPSSAAPGYSMSGAARTPYAPSFPLASKSVSPSRQLMPSGTGLRAPQQIQSLGSMAPAGYSAVSAAAGPVAGFSRFSTAKSIPAGLQEMRASAQLPPQGSTFVSAGSSEPINASDSAAPGQFATVASSEALEHAPSRERSLMRGVTMDVGERQLKLQQDMKTLQERQRTLLAQQAKQLQQQQLRPPWLVPCGVTPNATRLATITVLPPKEGEAAGSSARSGSCPIFSRCAAGSRNRSGGSRAGRTRRIGVYVQPPASAASRGASAAADVQMAGEETGDAAACTSWLCGPEKTPSRPAGLPAGHRYSPGAAAAGGSANQPLVLKVNVVPPRAGASADAANPGVGGVTQAPAALNPAASAEDGGVDPRTRQLWEENEFLKQENAFLRAQLGRARADDMNRRFSEIESRRRADDDVRGHETLIQEQEEENRKLRRQIADLGAALYAATEDGDFRATTEALVQMLTDAHKEVASLKKAMRCEARSAHAAQTDIMNALKLVNRGGDVFATDPNDVTVGEAATDSLVSQGKRLVAQGQESVWTALSSMKDLVDQVFDRMKRLLTSTCTDEEKIQYLESLHLLVVGSLDGTLEAYDELAATCSKFDQLRAVVFDPKRNSPYCPCRPRRQVLEDDLKHLTRQNKEASEKLRQLRARVVKLEMENLKFYVKQADGVSEAESRLAASLSTNQLARELSSRSQSPFQRDARSGDRTFDETTSDGHERGRQAGRRKGKRESKTKLILRRRDIVPDCDSEDDVTSYQVTTAIKKLQNEIERLKDERQFDRTKDAEREQHLTRRITAGNRALAEMLNDQDRLLEQLLQMIDKRNHMYAAGAAAAAERAHRQALQEDLEQSRSLISQSSMALLEGQAPEPGAFNRLLTRLKSIKPVNMTDMTDEERELLQMAVNELTEHS
ncbi:hypothetical protein BESB_059590 [Besnoitia besnoiti]|uniref:Uncharacterized protein n=1 Tax=Besnoitia besnoiti TaxID=94643 RepID=A0A2A9MI49_BESBE|nr:hypothetical protein BESB_059590 [Besnoitia besnoiti]PFH35072.1 hypothetical protein BESB_059590 [Besnoitia besnoiti]